MKTTTAVVVRYNPPTAHRPSATVEIACPFGCLETTPTGRTKKGGGPARHVHGIGAADSRPDLSDRVAHCRTNLGRGYVLQDPRGLVPEVLVSVQAVAR